MCMYIHNEMLILVLSHSLNSLQKFLTFTKTTGVFFLVVPYSTINFINFSQEGICNLNLIVYLILEISKYNFALSPCYILIYMY